MGLVASVILVLMMGSSVGWVASSVVKMDVHMKLLLGAGVLGSFLGVAVAYMMDFGPYGPIGSSLVSIVGASLLIAVLQSAGVFSKLTTAA
jgi:uncharacterized membrane protein YeaQ/YmgE (transglycosylase-associated protein family)